MWWKKDQSNRDLVPHREQLIKMAGAVLSASGLEFDHATPLEQALIGTFLFGMIYAYGMSYQLTPPEVHGLTLLVFKDSLHYTDSAAAQGVQECINATDPNSHPTMNSILHRGIDGHKQYQEVDISTLQQNLTSILAQFK